MKKLPREAAPGFTRDVRAFLTVGYTPSTPMKMLPASFKLRADDTEIFAQTWAHF